MSVVNSSVHTNALTFGTVVITEEDYYEAALKKAKQNICQNMSLGLKCLVFLRHVTQEKRTWKVLFFSLSCTFFKNVNDYYNHKCSRTNMQETYTSWVPSQDIVRAVSEQPWL